MNIFRKITVPVLLLCAIEAFLLLYFPPFLILDPTVTMGGDTHSHFMAAAVMRSADSLFSPITWFHGNFCGFPLFLHYFPFPFMLMALASLITSLEVAFKLITLLAIIPLPAAVFYSLRRLGQPGQVSAAGAALCLPFLMMSENHMWGGNITSTLAGEFSFGISFILAIVLMGRLFTDAPRRRSLVVNSIIEALITLSNGYPILHSGMASSYFIVRGCAVRYIVLLHALALGWTAFWLLPLIRYASWNSPFAHWWSFQSAFELFPPLLWPAFAGAFIALGFQALRLPRRSERPEKGVISLEQLEVPGTDHESPAATARDIRGASTEAGPGPSPEAYLWWQFGIALLGFGIAPYFGLVDIRFLPFAQIGLVMLGAIGWSRFILWLPRPNIWLTLFTAAMVVLSFSGSATVESWTRWNYSGAGTKPLAEPFRQTTGFLAGSENNPRVVFENSDITTGAGTVRAFEMLPYYSGRSTLEGLYMQSALSAPFVYYIQSELSPTPSIPFTSFYYSRFDLDRAVEHLRLFNVDQVISVTDGARNALDFSPDFERQAWFPPFTVHQLKDAAPSYVTPLRFQPRRIPDRNWKTVQYEWLRKSSLKSPLIVAGDNTPGDYWKTVPVLEGTPVNIPEIPIDGPEADVVEADAVLSGNRISVTTSKPGHPLWLKISYHPCWRISEGTGELYLASPSFMLLVPGTAKVTLEFDTRSGIFTAGKILTLLTACVCVGVLAIGLRRKKPKPLVSNGCGPASSGRDGAGRRSMARWVPLSANARLITASAVIASVVLGTILTRSETNPQLLFEKAEALYERANSLRGGPNQGPIPPEDAAEKEKLEAGILSLLDRNIREFPESAVLDNCIYYKAILLVEKDPDTVRRMLEAFLETHPDTRILAEIFQILGEIHLRSGETAEADRYFRQAVFTWPEAPGGRRAGEHLVEITGADAVFDEARGYYETGDYLRAYSLLRVLIFLPESDVREDSILWLGYCCFYLGRWEEASNLLLQWLNGHFDDPGSVDAQHIFQQCNVTIQTVRDWQGAQAEVTTPMGRALRMFGLAR